MFAVLPIHLTTEKIGSIFRFSFLIIHQNLDKKELFSMFFHPLELS